MIHLGVIEDEPLVTQSISDFMAPHPSIDVALTAGGVEEFLDNLLPGHNINMILLDINLTGMSGLEGIRHIKDRLPNANIIMLTSMDDSDGIFKALCAGAVSYISKKTQLKTIQEAMLTVHNGGAYMSPTIARKVINHFAPKKQAQGENPLTPRQQQIVRGLVDGLSYKLIADKLLISVETVRDHIKNIYRKLQVNSKAEVIKKVMDGEI